MMPYSFTMLLVLFICGQILAGPALSAAPISVGQFSGATSVRDCLNTHEFAVAGIRWSNTRTNWSSRQWADLLSRYDVIVFPGGSGGEMYGRLGREGQQAVRNYVSQGGGYLGICAGAWLASKRYLGIANIEGIRPWYVGVGGLQIAMEEKAGNVFSSIHYRAPALRMMEMHNGPMWSLTPPDPSRPCCHVLASYTDKRGTNKMGREFFRGKPAIVTDVYGRGRIVLFSPHPELVSTNGNYDMIAEAVRWLVAKKQPEHAGAKKTDMQQLTNDEGRTKATHVSEAAERAVESCLVSNEGGLPVILSAPHGGGFVFPGVPVRSGGNGVKQFAIARDVNTDLLALELSAALLRETGKSPFLVVAKVSRKYVDFNRAEKDAYESPQLREVYAAYHGRLEKYCRSVVQKWGGGLLIDLHAQSLRRDSIFRGTRNGATTQLLLKNLGQDALTGSQGFLGMLETSGFKIIPACASKDKEINFNGGYIVGQYGLNGSYGIDAIQLEFGGSYTVKQGIPNVAKDLAQALRRHVALYPATPNNK